MKSVLALLLAALVLLGIVALSGIRYTHLQIPVKLLPPLLYFLLNTLGYSFWIATSYEVIFECQFKIKCTEHIMHMQYH